LTSRIGAIVLARLSSRRLPGKALMSLARRPLIAHVFERLARVEGLPLGLATSSEATDDPLAAWAEAEGIPVCRGALDDVLERLAAAAGHFGFESVIRISGDSPLLDPAIVRMAIAAAGVADLVTNVFPRSFPRGQSVEVLSRAGVARLNALAVTAEDREHVTRALYRAPDGFRILGFRRWPDRSDLQLSVDTREDLARAAAILASHPSPDTPLDALIRRADVYDAEAAP
jgi:spore coat polysaccharide biosynthesis protein SpsF